MLEWTNLYELAENVCCFTVDMILSIIVIINSLKRFYKKFTLKQLSFYLFSTIWIIIIKIGLSPFKKKFIYFNDSPSKMMKNAFYFILKALFVLKMFNFVCLDFFVMYKNGLIGKISLISKFMASQPG